jgi:hypothetical protein
MRGFSCVRAPQGWPNYNWKLYVSKINFQLGDKEEDNLKDAYCQTFDLIDLDSSGTLDKEELTEWMNMCGAELDVNKIIGVLLPDGDTLTRDKFAMLMCSSATSCRREYDIDGSSSGHH